MLIHRKKYILILYLLLTNFIIENFSLIYINNNNNVNKSNSNNYLSLIDNQNIANLSTIKSVNISNKSLSNIEIEEALVFEYAVINGIYIMKSSFKTITHIFRSFSDTIAGMISISIKSIGGIFKLLSDIIYDCTLKVNKSNNHNNIILKVINNIMIGLLHTISTTFNCLGETCLVAGDTIELLSVSIGQALEDSYGSLSHLLQGIKQLLLYMLHRYPNQSNYQNMSTNYITTNQSINNIVHNKHVNSLLQSVNNKKIKHIPPTSNYHNYLNTYNDTNININTGLTSYINRLINYTSLSLKSTLFNSYSYADSQINQFNKKSDQTLDMFIYTSNYDITSNTNNINSKRNSLLDNEMHISTDSKLNNQLNNDTIETNVTNNLSNQLKSNITSNLNKTPNLLMVLWNKLTNRVKTNSLTDFSNNGITVKNSTIVMNNTFNLFSDILVNDIVSDTYTDIVKIDSNNDSKVDNNIKNHKEILKDNKIGSKLDNQIDSKLYNEIFNNKTSDKFTNQSVRTTNWSHLIVKFQILICLLVISIYHYMWIDIYNYLKSYNYISKKLLVYICILLYLIIFIAIYSYIISIYDVHINKLLVKNKIESIHEYNNIQNNDINKESTNWLNNLLSVLWLVHYIPNYSSTQLSSRITDHQVSYRMGGLGLYISNTIEVMLNRQLSLVPPGVANIKLKRFLIGSKPPIIHSMQTNTHNCYLSHHIYNNITDNLLKSNYDNTIDFFSLFHKHFLQGFMHYSEIISNNSKSFDYSSTNPSIDYSTNYPNNMTLCRNIIGIIDFTYISSDMDIVLSLRSIDVKSLLPEATITLSGLSMIGTLHMDIDIIPEYPFFGNASVSFLQLPEFDVTISSFGGVELSSIPGVYHWMNITIAWLLNQYTYPKFNLLDLKHTICPRCDQPPQLTPQEIIIQMVHNTSIFINQMKHKLQHQLVTYINKQWENVKSDLNTCHSRYEVDWLDDNIYSCNNKSNSSIY